MNYASSLAFEAPIIDYIYHEEECKHSITQADAVISTFDKNNCSVCLTASATKGKLVSIANHPDASQAFDTMIPRRYTAYQERNIERPQKRSLLIHQSEIMQTMGIRLPPIRSWLETPRRHHTPRPPRVEDRTDSIEKESELVKS